MGEGKVVGKAKGEKAMKDAGIGGIPSSMEPGADLV